MPRLAHTGSQRNKKTVYLPMAVDLIHHGHINIVQVARSLGRVTVGLLVDAAIARYKRVPRSTFAERRRVIENIQGVAEVIPQETDDYLPIIKRLKPDYFVHGDDWKVGIQAEKRARVIEAMRAWGGEVVEPAYTGGISTTCLIEGSEPQGMLPEARSGALQRALSARPLVRFCEAYDAQSASIVDTAKEREREQVREWDGIWMALPTERVARGLSADALIDLTLRRQTLEEIMRTTMKPVAVEVGALPTMEALLSAVKALERHGAAVCVVPAQPTPTMQRDFLRAWHDQRLSSSASVWIDLSPAGGPVSLAFVKSALAAGAEGFFLRTAQVGGRALARLSRAYARIGAAVPLLVAVQDPAAYPEAHLTALGIRAVAYEGCLVPVVGEALKEASARLLFPSGRRTISSL